MMETWENGLKPMPSEKIGKYFNGQCPDACDMVEGPCACGAWHHLSQWPKEIQQEFEESEL